MSIGGRLAQADTPPAVPSDPNALLVAQIGREAIPISREKQIDNLIKDAGERAIPPLLDYLLVTQEMKRANIQRDGEAFSKLVQQEVTLTIMNVPGEGDLEAKAKTLESTLKAQGVPTREFQLGMETRAALRMLTAGAVNVTDQNINDAYHAEFGPRRSITIIQVNDQLEADKVWGLVVNQKQKPVDVSNTLHLRPALSRIMPENAAGPEAIKKAAFTLLQKEGDLSPLITLAENPKQEGMIYLEKIFPDQRPTHPLTDALKAEYRKRIQNTMAETAMQNRLQHLRDDVARSPEIKDPDIAAVYARMKAMEPKPTSPAP